MCSLKTRGVYEYISAIMDHVDVTELWLITHLQQALFHEAMPLIVITLDENRAAWVQQIYDTTGLNYNIHLS